MSDSQCHCHSVRVTVSRRLGTYSDRCECSFGDCNPVASDSVGISISTAHREYPGTPGNNDSAKCGLVPLNKDLVEFVSPLEPTTIRQNAV